MASRPVRYLAGHESKDMTTVRASFLNGPRPWLALGFFVITYLAFDPLESAIYHPLATALGLQMIQDVVMAPVPYSTLMIVRLALDLLMVARLLVITRSRLNAFPLYGPATARGRQ